MSYFNVEEIRQAFMKEWETNQAKCYGFLTLAHATVLRLRPKQRVSEEVLNEQVNEVLSVMRGHY